MGTSILKGITTGLLVTVLTLLIVLGTTLAGIEKNIIAYIIDFGLLSSCLAAGFKASSNSRRILPGGLAAGGYAIVGILLLALYFSIDILGAIKIISEGTGLGFLAGVMGAGALGAEPEHYERISETPYIYKRKSEPYGSSSMAYAGNREEERAKILELCNRNPEKSEEEEAFDWWRVEAKRQLKGR